MDSLYLRTEGCSTGKKAGLANATLNVTALVPEPMIVVTPVLLLVRKPSSGCCVWPWPLMYVTEASLMVPLSTSVPSSKPVPFMFDEFWKDHNKYERNSCCSSDSAKNSLRSSPSRGHFRRNP